MTSQKLGLTSLPKQNVCRAEFLFNEFIFGNDIKTGVQEAERGAASISAALSVYLSVSQSEGDMVKLVNVSRFDGCGDDLGVDSDFPSSCIARVVGDTWVAARLQDVTDAVISHKHH